MLDLADVRAIRSTPGSTLDALMHLLPLHQFGQLELEKTALKLKRYKNILEGDLTGHLEMLSKGTVNLLVLQIEVGWNQNLS